MSENIDNTKWSKEMDKPEHETTYEAFINYSKYGTIIVCAILLGLLVFVY